MREGPPHAVENPFVIEKRLINTCYKKIRDRSFPEEKNQKSFLFNYFFSEEKESIN